MAQIFPATLPWWKSRILMGALVSVVFKALAALSITDNLPPEVQSEWLEIVLLLASAVGDIIVAQARVVQKAAPPITVADKVVGQ